MKAKKSFTDYELVRAIHMDNKEVLDYLFERNHAEAKKLILANGGSEEEADNVLRQAIVELWYEINHQHFKPEKALNTHLINLLKEDFKHVSKGTSFFEKINNPISKNYDLEVVIAFTGTLEPQYKTILSYRYFEGYDFSRIANILNLSNEHIVEKIFNEAYQQLLSLLKVRYSSIERDMEQESIIINGVRTYRYRELLNFIKHNAIIPKEKNNNYLAWIIAALISGCVAYAIWYYSGNVSIFEGARKDQVIIQKSDSTNGPYKKDNQKEFDIKKQHQKSGQSIGETDTMQISPTDTGKLMDEEIQNPKGKIQKFNSKGDIVIKEMIDTLGNTDIVVKKDEFLYTLFCKVLDKTEPSDSLDLEKNIEQNSSLTNKTAELLNPQAKLPKDEQRIKVYQVELWKSPVNYKGYKMQKNKIIIYGIEDPDMISLFSFDETLYLNSGTGFYMLIPSMEFRPFVKLKDKSILAELTK